MVSDWSMVGYLAAFCTTVAFVPQVLRILRTRDTHSISIGMYAIFTFGVFLWLVYGVLTDDLPIILANAVTFSLASVILILKARDLWQAKRTG